MPKRRNQTKRSFKRRGKSSYRSRRRRGTFAFNKAPMPNKFPTKLRYQENVSINPSVGVPGLQVVTANGLFDPNITGVGHQPRGFDQLMAMYDHYTVIGAKITATFMLREGLAYDSMNVGIALKDATGIENLNGYLEGRNVRSRVLRGSDGAATVVGMTTISMSSSTSKFLGRSKVLADPELKGNVSSNPTEQLYFHIFAQAVQGGDAQPIDVTYRIDYLVVFTEPKQPGQS